MGGNTDSYTSYVNDTLCPESHQISFLHQTHIENHFDGVSCETFVILWQLFHAATCSHFVKRGDSDVIRGSRG